MRPNLQNHAYIIIYISRLLSGVEKPFGLSRRIYHMIGLRQSYWSIRKITAMQKNGRERYSNLFGRRIISVDLWGCP